MAGRNCATGEGEGCCGGSGGGWGLDSLRQAVYGDGRGTGIGASTCVGAPTSTNDVAMMCSGDGVEDEEGEGVGGGEEENEEEDEEDEGSSGSWHSRSVGESVLWEQGWSKLHNQREESWGEREQRWDMWTAEDVHERDAEGYDGEENEEGELSSDCSQSVGYWDSDMTGSDRTPMVALSFHTAMVVLTFHIPKHSNTSRTQRHGGVKG
jgi:hypothetical protein